jgi:PmbA protein
MMDEARALEIAEGAAHAGLVAGEAAAGSQGPVEAEAVLIAQRSALTRFSDFAIHQNVAEDDVRVSIRVVIAGRTGVAATNRLEGPAMRDAADKAARFALASPADPAFPGLPGPGGAAPAPAGMWVATTAEADPGRRALAAREIFSEAKRLEVSPSGSCSTAEIVVAVANSKGVSRAASATEAECSVVCTAPGGETGWAEWLGRDIDGLDPGKVAAGAADKATRAQRPAGVEPGEWTVVLEPAAVGELAGLLSYCGFGALAEQEGLSFMSGLMREKITGQAVTIANDPCDPRTLGLPFDFEGVPSRRVALIEKGVAKGVVYDTYTAAKAGVTSTGNALPAPNPYGPLAMNLLMEGGDRSAEDLVASVEKGLLVTRFFYTNPLDTKKTLVTGMTRDGLYLIENGRITGAAKNLRMTESVLEAFARIAGLSDTVEAHRSIIGTTVAPSALIEGFRFSSATEF